MSQPLVIADDCETADRSRLCALATTLNLPRLSQCRHETATLTEQPHFLLQLTPLGLQLTASFQPRWKPFRVDFIAPTATQACQSTSVTTATGSRQIRRSGQSRDLLYQVLGTQLRRQLTAGTVRVLDVTAGWGQDSYQLAQYGCEVCLIEQHPVVAALVADGIARGCAAGDSACQRMQLISGDSAIYLQDLLNHPNKPRPDLIYMDPMFHAEKQKAAVTKPMQLLRALLIEENLESTKTEFTKVEATKADSTTKTESTTEAALLKLALQLTKCRVVVKRHYHAPTLISKKPTHQLRGTRIRYDIYLNAM